MSLPYVSQQTRVKLTADFHSLQAPDAEDSFGSVTDETDHIAKFFAQLGRKHK